MNIENRKRLRYASWVGKEIRKEHRKKAEMYPPEVLCIHEKLFAAGDTEEILKIFDRAGYDSFSLSFIEALTGLIHYGLGRQKHTYLTEDEIDVKSKQAIKHIKSIQALIRKFGLDQRLSMLIPFEWRKLAFRGLGVDDEETLRLHLALDLDANTGAEGGTLIDLLSNLSSHFENIANEPLIVPEPNAKEKGDPDRIYLIRVLWVEFMRTFGRPLFPALYRIVNLVSEGSNISETYAAGCIREFKKKLKDHPHYLRSYPSRLEFPKKT